MPKLNARLERFEELLNEQFCSMLECALRSNRFCGACSNYFLMNRWTGILPCSNRGSYGIPSRIRLK